MPLRLPLKHFALAIGVALLLGLAAPGSAPAAQPAPAPRLLRSDAGGALIELRTPELHAQSLGADALPTLAGAAPDPEAGGLPVFYAILAAPPGATLSLSTPQADVRSLPQRLDLALAAELQTTPDGCSPAARITGDAFMRGQRLVTLALSPLSYCPASGELRQHPRLLAELRWRGGALPTTTLPADPFLDAVLHGALLNPDQAQAWRVAPTAAPAVEAAAERYKISVTHEGLYSIGSAALQAAGADLGSLDPRSFRLTTRGRPVAISVIGEADGRFDPADSLRFYGQPLTDAPVQDSVILNGALVVADTVVSASYSSERDYGDLNVYWLEFGGQPGPRMAAVDAAPQPAAPQPSSFRATARAEESLLWWTWHFTSRETWFWSRLTTSGTLTETYPLTLADPDPAGAPAELRAESVALAYSSSVSPDHRTRLLLNGELVEDATWDGPVRHSAVGNVPAASLLPGANQLSFNVLLQPGTGSDTIYVDWFELRYDRLFRAVDDRLRFDYPGPGPWRLRVDGLSAPAVSAYELSDPLAPRLLTNLAVTSESGSYSVSFSPPVGAGRYLVTGQAGLEQPAKIERRVATNLRAATNGADYIFIAPAELRAATQALADYRSARGMRTSVVDLADLIDEFNDGIYHPVAIKRFLAYAYATWQPPAPQYVLLVGDGHWNFRQHNPARYGGPAILMPPNLAWVDPFQGQVDSANQLASIVGDDILPDLAIGRLTARTPADITALLAKLTAHEAAPADAPWRRRLLFVADNGPDSAGDFAASMDRVLATSVPSATMQLDKLYLDAGCGPAQNPPQPCPQLTAALSATINLTGTLMLTYSGHGAVDGWAKERVLTNASAAGLRNAAWPSFVVSLDCLDGYWAYPGNESLVETLVRMPGGGAAAAFAPTGLGVATGHEQLQLGLYRALFAGGPQRIGPASMAAKLALFASGASRDLVDTYTIFGDPAMLLALPEELTGPPPDPTPGPADRSLFLPLVSGRRP